jgi:hypothetical protein
MPKYYLDIPISSVNGFQTFSVKARNLKSAKRKFKANESMTLESSVIKVTGFGDVEDSDLKEIYQYWEDQ